MVSIILIKANGPANVGSVARAMKNFGFNELILVNPKCDHLCLESIKMAKHAYDVLMNAQLKDETILDSFDTLIATTSKLGTDYNILRSPISPERCLENIPINSKVGILFGPEDSGLTNEEIKKADFTLAIPTSVDYPALNLSHAVGIVLYFLSMTKKIDEHIISASKEDKVQLLLMLEKVLSGMKFSTEDKRETQRKVWKKILGKSFLTKREAHSLMGFMRKILPEV
jgi:tRNA/rRNA methyltransferase